MDTIAFARMTPLHYSNIFGSIDAKGLRYAPSQILLKGVTSILNTAVAFA
jgi:hypothetical protein